ncbi:MAG TPA: carboxypeptidase-like regulatory domain-containing protein [Bryobacteraceae bacterium]|jgi:protocatechuate 3,4-dioxygenase beta subunit
MKDLRRAACVLALLLSALQAQDTGSLVGTVINGASGTGVTGMNVLLWTKGAQYQATTDDTGAFRIEQVASGSYRARFEKEGFVPLQQDRPPVVITAGTPASIRVEKNPYATLRGRVLDPGGKPVPDVEVDIRRSRGGLALHTAITDEAGAFIFDQLDSGSFVLFARPKSQSSENEIMIVPTYFPSVEERVQAEKILVRAGRDISGYEIRLRAAPVYRISGRVVDESGQPAPHATLALVSTAEGMSAPPGYDQQSEVIVFGVLKRETETGATAGEDGRFTFRSVRSGPWRLVANSHTSTEDRIATGGEALVTLADHDIDDLQISVAPLFTLTGTVAFKGDPPPDGTRIGRLMLTTTDVQGSIVASSRLDGTLRIANLVPGAYRIVAVPGAFGAYSPTSVLLGDREVLGQVVELTPTSPPLHIVYAATTGVVRGSVENGACALIVLLPNPLAQPATARSQPCTASGTFEIHGVPAGRYYALAFDRVDPASPPDDAFLRSAVVNAPTVEVGQGPAASLQLTITRWPD